jgi:hypothetical protein
MINIPGHSCYHAVRDKIAPCSALEKKVYRNNSTLLPY